MRLEEFLCRLVVMAARRAAIEKGRPMDKIALKLNQQVRDRVGLMNRSLRTLVKNLAIDAALYLVEKVEELTDVARSKVTRDAVVPLDDFSAARARRALEEMIAEADREPQGERTKDRPEPEGPLVGSLEWRRQQRLKPFGE